MPSNDGSEKKESRRKFLIKSGLAISSTIAIGAMIKSQISNSSAEGQSMSIDTLTSMNTIVDSTGLADKINALDSAQYRVIDGDTVSKIYVPPIFADSSRMKYMEQVAITAAREMPECQPYIETMMRANYNYRTIFDFPLEFHFALINQESRFNPLAVSYAHALGIAQFMRATAKEMGLKTYSENKFPELTQAEDNLSLQIEKRKLFLAQMQSYIKKESLTMDMAKEIIELNAKYNAAKKEVARADAFVKDTYKSVLHELDDERITNPHKALDLSARMLAESGRRNEEEYGGRHAHTILRAIMAYNCGQRNVNEGDGWPNIPQTIHYVRNIISKADELMPREEMKLALERAPEQESGKIYKLPHNVIEAMTLAFITERRWAA